MRIIQVTSRIRIRGDEETFQSLRDTLFQYRDSFNRVCEIGWTKKRINGVELHHDTYQSERQNTNLPSQLVVSARAKATEALSSVRARQRKGGKATCPISKQGSIRYDARSSNIKMKEGYATLATINGRRKVGLIVSDYHKRYLDWKTCSADFVEGKRGKFYLNVVVQKDIQEPQKTGDIIGVDLGINRPAVTSRCS